MDFDEILGILLDEENTDKLIFVYDNSVYEAKQIAVIPVEGRLYAILRLFLGDENEDEGKVVAFYIDLKNKTFACVDDDIQEQVFEIYNKAVEEAENE